MKNFNLNSIVKIGIFGALVIVLSLTPIGLITIGPVRVTTVHIPIIIVGVLEGKTVGALVGLIFGLFSFFQHLSGISVLSFMFINPLVSVFPRIMIGYTSGLIYEKSKHIKHITRLIFSSIVGTISNTFGVLFFAYIFFASRIGKVLNKDPLAFILGIASTNGVAELILACIVVPVVCLRLNKIKNS